MIYLGNHNLCPDMKKHILDNNIFRKIDKKFNEHEGHIYQPHRKFRRLATSECLGSNTTTIPEKSSLNEWVLHLGQISFVVIKWQVLHARSLAILILPFLNLRLQIFWHPFLSEHRYYL